MSNASKRPHSSRPNKYSRSKSVRRSRNRAPRGSRMPWIVMAVVIVIGVALVVTAVSNRDSKSSSRSNTLAPAALVKTVSSVPQSVLTKVGAGSADPLPKAIDAPALAADGKPLVVYVGAEYCPYCAAERWAMVQALSRFGTFSKLELTHSSSSDVFPSTPTFSFHGATFSSDVLAFQGVETQGNELSGGSYPTLDTLTAEQQQLMVTYNAPPYVTSNGAIPFIDIGGKYVVSGATFSPTVLQGKSASQIANALSDASNSTTQGVIGAANTLTAAICKITNNQPATVCADPSIQQIQTQLK